MISYQEAKMAPQHISDALTGNNAFNMAGADGFSGELSTLWLAPATISQPFNLSSLDGAIIGAVYVENATSEASLPNGLYNLRMTLKEGQWTGDVLSNGVVVKTAQTVRIVPTSGEGIEPQMIALEVGSAAWFGLGLIIGGTIVWYLR